MDIAEVAKRSGLPASTLRYYEEKGLIASTGRQGLRRTFDPGVLELLSLISLGQAAGFSLDEIAQMYEATILDIPRAAAIIMQYKRDNPSIVVLDIHRTRIQLRHNVPLLSLALPSHGDIAA